MNNYIIKTGIRGGSSVLSVDPSNIQTLDLGIDGNIRIVYKNGERTFPIIEVLEASEEFTQEVSRLANYS